MLDRDLHVPTILGNDLRDAFNDAIGPGVPQVIRVDHEQPLHGFGMRCADVQEQSDSDNQHSGTAAPVAEYRQPAALPRCGAPCLKRYRQQGPPVPGLARVTPQTWSQKRPDSLRGSVNPCRRIDGAPECTE